MQVVENLLVFGVWRVALVIKFDATSGLEGAWVQVMQKVLKMSPNGRPGVYCGAPFGGLEPPWGRFGHHFDVRRCYFLRFVREISVLVISTPHLQRNRYF